MQILAQRQRLVRFAMPAFAAFMALLAGCERVIDLDVSQGPRKLIVEARLERILGTVSGAQAIRLSTTSDYFGDETSPPARGAIVQVTDNLNNPSTFTESATPGTYTTDALNVVRGRTYTLHITFEGQQYEATESTRPVAPISRLYFDTPSPGRYSGTDGIRATIDFTDRPGERNYYLWEQYVNGVRQLGPDSTVKMRITATDDGIDGIRVTGLQPYEGINIPPNAAVLVRQVALSESMYRYYTALSDQLANDGSPFAVAPASLRGNVANKTDSARPAGGYFAVAEVSEARAVYKP